MTWQLGLNATTLSANMKHLSSLASTMHQPYRPRRITAARASGHMLRKSWRSKGSCTSSNAEELGIPRSVKVSTYFIFLHVSTASNTRKRSCEVLILNLFFVRSPPDDCLLQLSELQAWHNGKAKASQEHHSTLATAESETSCRLRSCCILDSIGPLSNESICINRLISTRSVLGMRCLRESKDVDREEFPPLPWMKHHGQGPLR